MNDQSCIINVATSGKAQVQGLSLDGPQMLCDKVKNSDPPPPPVVSYFEENLQLIILANFL